MSHEPVKPPQPPSPPPSNPNSRVFQSSNLQSGQYDPLTSNMRLTFTNGSIYVYANVESSTWEGLRDAVSPGSYFSSNIRKATDAHGLPKYPSYKQTAIG